MMKRTPLGLLGLYQPSWEIKKKGYDMKTGQLILEAMQSVLDELKTSDSKAFDTRRTRVLSLLSEAYENYSPITFFEDAESR
ncbi:hypothetical protein KJW53_07250 [Streptococcus macedonicus]|uniref:hypothetical protein n=1 Tax=Streptococcus macedonicus TaxID=59310 RepID=UPI001BDCD88F|nr:hypothetical protein [Streptococcus macedonicus]MBT1048583.1 hypothetical protein [Streptococcus macedonicus]